MAFEFQVVLEHDPSYFDRTENARLTLDTYGQNDWELVAVVPLEENRGYAFIMQRQL
jgi:hypothetical protein